MWIPRARHRWLGRAAAAALFAISLLAPAGGAVGASPAVGVVTVTVFDDETHSPLAGADVSLTGFVSSAADPVYEASRTATSAGTATFSNVPLSVSGDVVSVSAEATLADTTTTEGCTVTETWSGIADPVTAAPTTAIDVSASREESATCTPPGPDAPVLRGTVLGADGLPFVPTLATVSMRRGDGGTWDGRLTVESDGSFSTPVEPWGTADEPADLVVHVTGAIVATETDGECTYDLAPDGSLVEQVAFADDTEPAPVTIVADIGRVAAVCGTTGTPAPSTSPKPKPSATATATPTPSRTSGGSAATPRATLPPTDRLGASPAAPDDGVGVAIRLLALACVGAGIAFAAGRVRRER